MRLDPERASGCEDEAVVQLLITIPACTVLAEENGLKAGCDGRAGCAWLSLVCGFVWDWLPDISNPLRVRVILAEHMAPHHSIASPA